MSIFGITGVRLSPAGRVVRATICQIDPKTNTWIGRPNELDGSALASMVVKGDVLYSLFTVNNQRVIGPKFRHAVYAGGEESVELEEDVPGRRLGDLVLMV